MSPQGRSHWRVAFRPRSSGACVARGVGMRETCREHALAHSPAHAPAHARRTLWHTLRRKLRHTLRYTLRAGCPSRCFGQRRCSHRSGGVGRPRAGPLFQAAWPPRWRPPCSARPRLPLLPPAGAEGLAVSAGGLAVGAEGLLRATEGLGAGSDSCSSPPAPALTSPPPRTEEGSGPGDGVRRSLSFSLYAASAAAFACLVHSYQRLRGKRPLSAALMDC